MISTSLKTWQLGLIAGLSAVFTLFLLILSVFCYRRYRYSKQLALSQINLYDNIKSMKTNGIPQGQIFQRVPTIVQPKCVTHTTISWIQDDTLKNISSHDFNRRNFDVSEVYNQMNFVNHTKIDDSMSSSNVLPMSKLSVISKSTILAHSTMNTLLNSSDFSIDQTNENKLNKSVNTIFNQSMAIDSNLSVPNYFINPSYSDEDLTDEDAWMSILDVANAELAILDSEDKTNKLM